MASQSDGISRHVVPEALRENADAWERVSGSWTEFVELASDYAVMGAADLGLLGRKTGFGRDYNAARETIVATARAGLEQIDDVKRALGTVAREYENKDAGYYERFGYTGAEAAEATPVTPRPRTSRPSGKRSSMADGQKPEWPENAAKQVQAKAEEYDHKSALDALAMIRDALLGDVDRMEEVALWWGRAPQMADSAAVIDESSVSLAEYWQGDGYDSYTTYAIDAAKRISRNEEVLDEIAATCEACVDIVYATYGEAITAISSCADQIAEASADFLEDVINPFNDAANGIRMLNGFVRRVSDVIEAAVGRMDDLRQAGVFLAQQAKDFGHVGELAEAAGNSGSWAVKPLPEESAAAH